MNIRIGIVGYGNLARGVEASVQLQPDMELEAYSLAVKVLKLFLVYLLTLWKIFLISKVKSMLWFFVAVPQQTLSNKHQW